MENDMFTNIKKMYDHKLYDCVIPAAGLLLTLMHNDRNLATQEVEYQVQHYLAGAQFEERQFRAALRTLQELIQQRSQMVRKRNGLTAIESVYAEFGDVEMRRRLAECYKQLGNTQMAIRVLLQVPVKSRTPRINLMLARLQHYGDANSSGRNKAEALYAYKEVIRECPMALPLIQEMLEMGCEGSEVNSLVMNAATLPPDIDWLSIYVKALAQMFNCRHLDAARTFEQLTADSCLRCSEHLLLATGKCYYYHGQLFQAEQCLSAALRSNPYNLEVMGVLSVVMELGEYPMAERDQLYAKLDYELESVSEHPHLITAHQLFLRAHFMFVERKFERGLGLLRRCLQLEPRHPEALLLRARLYTDMERYTEAAGAYRDAQIHLPYRFEVFKGLFNCYLAQKRYAEAQAMCTLTLRRFQASARCYILFGRTLFSSGNPSVKKTARKFAQRALQIDANYMPAVALMADIYELEGNTGECLKLLEQHTTYHPHADFFVQMGNMQRMEKQPIKALEYYYKALGMNPKSLGALQGINSLKGSSLDIELIAGIKRSTEDKQPIVKPEFLGTGCIDSSSSLPNAGEAVSSCSNSPRSGRENEDVSELDTTSEQMWQDVDVEMVNLNTSF
nr:anaphase-promoting complex subunit 7 [Drosophila kikkawai]